MLTCTRPVITKKNGKTKKNLQQKKRELELIKKKVTTKFWSRKFTDLKKYWIEYIKSSGVLGPWSTDRFVSPVHTLTLASQLPCVLNMIPNLRWTSLEQLKLGSMYSSCWKIFIALFQQKDTQLGQKWPWSFYISVLSLQLTANYGSWKII